MNSFDNNIIDEIDKARDGEVPEEWTEEIESKIKDLSLVPGATVAWYYKEDVEFTEEAEEDPRDITSWEGIVIPMPNIEYRGGELEAEECLIALTNHPCEKCYPETALFTLCRLVEDQELVRVFNR